MSFRSLLCLFPLLAALGGCTPKIGNRCSISTDCSQLGDRLCDTTQPGGYCTVFNCEPDQCPSSICVAFDPTLDPACGTTADGRWPRFERSFCLAQCSSNSDCRDEYECVDLGSAQNRTIRRAEVVDLGAADGGLGFTVCMASTCGDGIKDSNETDVDCGGNICNACINGKACNGGSDCLSSTCVNGVCVAPSCVAGMTDPYQTDTNCGGPDCAPCAPGKKCLVGSDCSSGRCGTDTASGVCSDGTCTDKAKNGDETDVDCGGIRCAPCAFGKVCTLDADCANLNCVQGVCATPAVCLVPSADAGLPAPYGGQFPDLDGGAGG